MTTREQNNNQPGSLDRSNNSGMGRKGKQNNFLKLNLPGEPAWRCTPGNRLVILLRRAGAAEEVPAVHAAAPGAARRRSAPARGGARPPHRQNCKEIPAAAAVTRHCLQDNLLYRIEGQDQEVARGQEEEVGLASLHNLIVLLQCVVCGSNRASMQTLPCAHQVTVTDSGSLQHWCHYCRWSAGSASSAQSRWRWTRSGCRSDASCAELKYSRSDKTIATRTAALFSRRTRELDCRNPCRATISAITYHAQDQTIPSLQVQCLEKIIYMFSQVYFLAVVKSE